MKSNIFRIIAAIMIATTAYLSYGYYSASNTPAPEHSITINGEEIIPSTTKYQVKYWGGYLNRETSIFLVNPISTDDSVNTMAIDGDVIDMTADDSYSYAGDQLTFSESGEYMIDITIDYGDGTICIYRLAFTVELQPEITISDLNPVQGELITVNIANVGEDDEMGVNCEFAPSSIYRSDNSAMFYIPVNYRYDPGTYDLDIMINESEYQYRIEVSEYSFSEIHFTVSESTSSSTVGNAEANSEYRRLIWPLYDTWSDEIYWDGSLIKPLAETRISSEFGQYRYINNATVPSRHSGIDYAAPCGTEIFAAAGGKVDIAYNLILSGNTVVIDHGLGFKSYYFHMKDLAVETGDVLEQGQLIGHVGMTGYATGCHLHFQTSIKNQPVNPELLYQHN